MARKSRIVAHTGEVLERSNVLVRPDANSASGAGTFGPKKSDELLAVHIT